MRQRYDLAGPRFTGVFTRMLLGLLVGIVCFQAKVIAQASPKPTNGSKQTSSPRQAGWVCDANFASLGNYPPFADFDWNQLLQVRASQPGQKPFDVRGVQRLQAVGTIDFGATDMQAKLRLVLESESTKQQAITMLQGKAISNSKLLQAGPVPGLPTLFIREVNAQSLDVGSADYLKYEQREYIAPAILQYWKDHPASPCRIAIDVNSTASEWKKWLAMLNLPQPWDTELLQLTQSCHYAYASVFFKGDAFLVIELIADDETQAQKIRAMSDGLLYFARFQMGSFLKEGSFGDGKVDMAIEQLLRDLTVHVNETTVSIRVPQRAETHLLVSHLMELLGKSVR